MIKQFSNEIAIKIGKLEKYDTEVIAYGLEMLFSTVLSITLLLCISLIFGYWVEMFVYICSFGLLRMSAGGYHAKSHLSCFLTYLVVSFLGIKTIQYIPMSLNVIFLIVLLAGSMILIYLFAPTQTANRPIYPKERERFRKRSIIIGYFLIILAISFRMWGLWNIALTIAIATFTQSLSLINIKKSN